METKQLEEAKARAEEVVNGFKQVSNQNARDALKLATECLRLSAIVSSLSERLFAAENKKSGADFADGIFGDLFGGKKK